MLAALLALKASGRRQVVIAHEIAAPWSLWPQRFWYALAHRTQWRQILRYADAIGFATEAWLERWTRSQPAFRFALLPSPSSIPVSDVGPDHAAAWRQKQGLPAHARVVAFFGSVSEAKQFPWVERAWRSAHTDAKPVALVAIGDSPATDQHGPFFKPLGYLPENEVSLALQAADVLALPFVDGVSERRTSFMTGLSHGCAVVTTLGHNTGPTLRAQNGFAATGATDAEGFCRLAAEFLNDDARRVKLREAAKAEYAQRYDWPVVVGALQRLCWD
ncbi:MAG: glycosyltransferase [Verrucomicrobiota bacterium]